MVEIAAVIVAVAFVILIGYLIPTILQMKRTIAESERLLARLNHELPVMLKDAQGTSENIRNMTDQARVGVDRASVLLNAVGEVGQTVRQVHGVVRGRGGSVVIGLTSVLAGLKAASQIVKERLHREGGNSNGK